MMNDKRLKNIRCEECSSRECLFQKSLPSEKLNKLSTIKNTVRYSKGQYIYQEGAQPSGIYSIQQGIIKIAKQGFGGREHIIYLSNQGDVFGMKDVFGKTEYSSSAATLEDSHICFIPKADFIFFLNDDLNLAKAVRDHFCSIQRTIEEKMLNLSQRSVRERLAIHLVELTKNFGVSQEANKYYINVSLSRDELANLVGTATETLIRLMSDFKKAEILSTKGKKITILDLPALKKISGI
jgi:CRP/FNR family transcriptional regulator